MNIQISFFLRKITDFFKGPNSFSKAWFFVVKLLLHHTLSCVSKDLALVIVLLSLGLLFNQKTNVSSYFLCSSLRQQSKMNGQVSTPKKSIWLLDNKELYPKNWEGWKSAKKSTKVGLMVLWVNIFFLGKNPILKVPKLQSLNFTRETFDVKNI